MRYYFKLVLGIYLRLPNLRSLGFLLRIDARDFKRVEFGDHLAK